MGKRFWNTSGYLNNRKTLSAAAEGRSWASRGARKLLIAKFRSEVSFEIDLLTARRRLIVKKEFSNSYLRTLTRKT